MDYFASTPNFNTLSLPDLLKARDQFHPHLLHKAHVVGAAVGPYLIREIDPYPEKRKQGGEPPKRSERKTPRTLEHLSA